MAPMSSPASDRLLVGGGAASVGLNLLVLVWAPLCRAVGVKEVGRAGRVGRAKGEDVGGKWDPEESG